MTIRFLTLFLAFFMLSAAAAPGKLVRPGQKISWTMGEGKKVYRLGDMTLTFDRVQCAPLGEDCEDGDVEPFLMLIGGDGKSVKIKGSPMQNIVMLGPLKKGEPVAAFVQTYSGGMHCCQEMRAVVPGSDGLKIVELGGYDGSEIGWPKDIDGDGMLDFVVSDDRFLYAFESYAGSVAPPMVLNVIDDRKVDVSADPRFRRLFEKAAGETRKACLKEEYPNGVCAAWAANAARLGQLDAVMPLILAEIRADTKIWPDKCKVARDSENGTCPDGQLIEYPDYASGLRAYLAELGYTPPA